MRSLFVRIFVSFWAALLLFTVLAILVTIAVNPARGIESRGAEILADAVNVYQTKGEKGAREYLEGVRNTEHARVFVFDSAGKELGGRHVPPWIEESRRGISPHGFMDGILPSHIKRLAWTLDGKRYTLIMEMPPGFRVFFGPHAPLLLTLAVITSGLVCYLLARSMTRPVTRLRQAAQSLAAGDLTARTGVPPGRRGSEMVELMRDFDRMAERLETLVESQSRLLKDVSHELRSPLARLSVALGLARQRGTPEIQGQLNRIELEADRLNMLIQRLLTISRLESGTDGLHKRNLSLRDLIEQIVCDAEFENAGRSCRVVADNDDEFLVEADADLLRSAIENVVRNALRYTADGTTVGVVLGREDGANAGEIVVRVSDSGPGVPEESLTRIFEPFYRIDDARNRQTGGAGLGLAIADRAIRLHEGRVRASNRREGGLEVEIRIPAAPGFVPQSDGNGRPGAQTIGSSGDRVIG
jgi:two-component system, OmpR family, sensor histidine kinase CpxA